MTLFLNSSTFLMRVIGLQDEGPMPSKDLRGTSTGRAQAARGYVNAIQPTAKFLDMLVKAFFPKEYAKLKPTEAAGRWTTEADQGCFLGLATVWKLQVDAHIDQRDYEICAITCGGAFQGGHLHLPDLNVTLKYVHFGLPHLSATVDQ